MKLLLEFVTCSGSCTPDASRPASEEARLLVARAPRRRAGRKLRSGGHVWRPSLSSISEDAMAAQRIDNKVERRAAERIDSKVERRAAERNISSMVERLAAEFGWRKSLKTKISSISRRDRDHSFDRDYGRRGPEAVSVFAIPTFSPTAFMF